MLEIYEGVLIVEPFPALYLESIDAVVLADLHLGIEGALEKEGVFLPVSISEKAIEQVKEAVGSCDARTVILLGDIKHEFGFPNPSEWIEVRRLLEWLQSRKVRVEVVRGNHDNYLIALLKRLDIPLHKSLFTLNSFSFTHGHLLVMDERLGEYVLLGHEHPSVSVREKSGVLHKFKCFLAGECRGRRIIVLPAVNEMTGGTDLNRASPEDLLSPILRHCDLKTFRPYLLEVGKVVKRFPRLGLLNSVFTPSRETPRSRRK